MLYQVGNLDENATHGTSPPFSRTRHNRRLWLVALATLVVFSACRRETTPASRPTVQTQASNVENPSDRAVVNEEYPTEPIETTVHLPVPRAGGPVSGLPVTALDTLLASEASRVDPAVDGWTTESFTEGALAQLKKLAAWLENHSEQADLPPGVFESDMSATDLRPNDSKLVLDASGFNVRRWNNEIKPTVRKTTSADLRNSLLQLLPANEGIQAEFKIIGVNEFDGGVVSRVRCHLSAANSEFRVQQNAAWDCKWIETARSAPKLASIELVEFEEIRTKEASILFSDRTPAVLNATTCYSQQLSFPLDHWRDRMDWRLGWEVAGVHGIAVGDVNGDGLEDVYFAETGGLPNRLFVQQADGTVQDISREAGVDVMEPTHGALIIDLDNDGDQDLVAAVGASVVVFENEGSARFKRHATLTGGSRIRSLAAADYDQDGLLDIFACGYSMGQPVPYHDANNGAPSSLLHNQGGFRFANVTSEVGLDMNNSRFTYAAAWEDFDNDGDLDLYVANDYGRNNLYRNDNGQFSDVAAAAGVEDVAAGMSVSWGDYNRDGLLDLYVGNMFSSAGNRIAYQRQFRTGTDDETRAIYQRHARGNSLFENVGDGTFRDVSQEAAVTEARWAWGSNFADINNDGWQDIIIANGMITGTNESSDL